MAMTTTRREFVGGMFTASPLLLPGRNLLVPRRTRPIVYLPDTHAWITRDLATATTSDWSGEGDTNYGYGPGVSVTSANYMMDTGAEWKNGVTDAAVYGAMVGAFLFGGYAFGASIYSAVVYGQAYTLAEAFLDVTLTLGGVGLGAGVVGGYKLVEHVLSTNKGVIGALSKAGNSIIWVGGGFGFKYPVDGMLLEPEAQLMLAATTPSTVTVNGVSVANTKAEQLARTKSFMTSIITKLRAVPSVTLSEHELAVLGQALKRMSGDNKTDWLASGVAGYVPTQSDPRYYTWLYLYNNAKKVGAAAMAKAKSVNAATAAVKARTAVSSDTGVKYLLTRLNRI